MKSAFLFVCVLPFTIKIELKCIANKCYWAVVKGNEADLSVHLSGIRVNLSVLRSNLSVLRVNLSVLEGNLSVHRDSLSVFEGEFSVPEGYITVLVENLPWSQRFQSCVMVSRSCFGWVIFTMLC